MCAQFHLTEQKAQNLSQACKIRTHNSDAFHFQEEALILWTKDSQLLSVNDTSHLCMRMALKFGSLMVS